LTLKTIGILRREALYSRSPEFDHLSRLRAEARPVCHFTVAVPLCPDVLMPAPTKRDLPAVSDNTAASRPRHQFRHALISRSTRNLIPAMKTGWRQLKVPCVLYMCTSVLTLTRRQKSTCALYTSAHYTRDFTVTHTIKGKNIG